MHLILKPSELLFQNRGRMYGRTATWGSNMPKGKLASCTSRAVAVLLKMGGLICPQMLLQGSPYYIRDTTLLWASPTEPLVLLKLAAPNRGDIDLNCSSNRVNGNGNSMNSRNNNSNNSGNGSGRGRGGGGGGGGGPRRRRSSSSRSSRSRSRSRSRSSGRSWSWSRSRRTLHRKTAVLDPIFFGQARKLYSSPKKSRSPKVGLRIQDPKP